MSEELKKGSDSFWVWTTRLAIGIIAYLLMNISTRFEVAAQEIQHLRTDIEVIKNTGAKSTDIEVLKNRVENIEQKFRIK